MISRYSRIPQLVQPTTDLGLKEIQNALTIKNAKIEQNYININNSLSGISKLDVIKGVDKDYLQGQLNRTVEEINLLGAEDLSDTRNIMKINTVVNSVLDDKNIKNALVSTQNIRKVQKQWEEINTNPKLSHLRHSNSAVNEWFDNQAMNNYLKDNTIGASFGQSKATIGIDTNKLYDDAAKKVQTKLVEEKDADGLTKWVTKQKSPAEIQAAVQQAMENNPEALAQEQRNFLFKYKNNPDKIVTDHNDRIDRTIKFNQDKIIELGIAQKASTTPENKEAIQKYIDTYSNQIETYKKNKINSTDPDFQQKAFASELMDKSTPFIQLYGGVQERKQVLDPVGAKKADILLKERQLDISKDKNDADAQWRKEQIRLKEADIITKISPAKALQHLLGSGSLADLNNEIDTDVLKTNIQTGFPNYTNAEEAYKKISNELMYANLDLASEIINDAIATNNKLNDKLQELIKEGKIKPYSEEGKIQKDKYVFSPAGLKTFDTYLNAFEESQGSILPPEIEKAKQILSQIRDNNTRDAIMSAKKEELYKKYGVKETLIDEEITNTPYSKGGIELQAAGVGQYGTTKTGKKVKSLTGNVEGANKEFLDYLSSTYSYYKIPIASINRDESKPGQFANLNQQVQNEMELNGLYAPDQPNKAYTKSNTIHGKKNDYVLKGELKDKNSDRIVDWEKSTANILPNSGEVEFILVDKAGNPVYPEEFPNGIAMTRVKKETLQDLYTAATGSTNKIDQFMGRKSVTYDDLSKMTDKTINEKFGDNNLLPIPGVPTKYNLDMTVSRMGDKFTIKVPGLGPNAVYRTTSVDQFTKNFAGYFQQIMNEVNGSTGSTLYSDLKTPQERLNAVKKALAKQLQYLQ
jgi:hypothetical protein